MKLRRHHETTGEHADTDSHHDTVTHESRGAVVHREREEHGGVKVGSAFFGWLTAMGMAVLLTALAAAAGVALGIGVDETDTSVEPETVGLAGGIVLLVILFVSYYCGGYVAGRMARFDGIKQGFAVWLWAIVVAIVVAILGVVAGSEYNVLDRLDGFPRVPSGGDNLTTGGIVVLVVVLLASLVGALLGGLAGMRFHRRVDRTGLGR